MLELKVRLRDTNENVELLRKKGVLPAVFYGPKETATPIALELRDFIRIWGQAGGSTIVTIQGVGDDKEVLIHEVTWHPVKDLPVHVDFYCIERGKKLTVTVPLEFVGEAPAEKLGGIVVKVMHELEIEVEPRNIPHDIKVDLATLIDLDSSITVADLHLPATIEPNVEPTETVASITQAKEEVEEERDISDVEIEAKGKEEETTEDSTEK